MSHPVRITTAEDNSSSQSRDGATTPMEETLRDQSNPSAIVEIPETITSQDPMPNALQGDCLVLEKRKKNHKQKEKVKAKLVEHKRAKDLNRFQVLNVDDAHKSSIVACSTLLTSANVVHGSSSSIKPTTWQRKRPWKENGPETSKAHQGSLDMNPAHNQKSSHDIVKRDQVSNSSKAREKESCATPIPKIIMIGDTKVFNLGGGAKSTMNLLHTGSNNYCFMVSETEDKIVGPGLQRDDNLSNVEVMDHETRGFEKLSHVDRCPTEGGVLTASEDFWRSLGYEARVVVEVVGHSGGIWVLGEVG
ncbi:hypothetical protein SESBI_26843 [Sesbania bispinosa]|nr:hypothetical protein SESBI_26843 [Sesbania bispinosa]